MPSKSVEELNAMLKLASIYQASNPHDAQIAFAISSLRDELAFRRFNEAHQQLLERHNRLDVSQERLRLSNEALKGSVEAVKYSVDRLAKPHWSVWATLVVAIIAAVASVIGYWPQIVAVFHKLIP